MFPKTPAFRSKVFFPTSYSERGLRKRVGPIQPLKRGGLLQVFQFKTPVAAMLGFSEFLASASGGQTSFDIKFSHYDEAPKEIRLKLIGAA